MMNSIECARAASAFDVLLYASEEKSLNESQALDHEAEMKKADMKARAKR